MLIRRSHYIKMYTYVCIYFNVTETINKIFQDLNRHRANRDSPVPSEWNEMGVFCSLDSMPTLMTSQGVFCVRCSRNSVKRFDDLATLIMVSSVFCDTTLCSPWKPVKKTELTTGGIRCADHATPSIRKS
jgi:hypothetical protein